MDTTALNLEEAELNYCQNRTLQAEKTAASELFVVQTHHFDARKAEAISISSDVPELMRARSFLMRGKLKEAAITIKNLNALTLAADTEILLEQSRLASFDGNWALCKEIATDALNQKPSSVTRLTLLQVRAVAYFEMGNHLDALNDLESAEALFSVLPNSTAGFYAKALECKVRAHLQGVSFGRNRLDALWKQTSVYDWNPNFLLTLCRIEVYILKLERKSTYQYALACHALAKQLGDRQYVALALADLADATPKSLRGSIESQISIYTKEFLRLKKWGENRTELDVIAEANEVLDCESIECIRQILFCDHNVLISFDPWSQQPLPDGKLGLAVQLLFQKKSMEKADFFRHLWGAQRYAPHLHDNLIWNLISRLRKKFGLKIIQKNSKIELTPVSVQVRSR